MKINERSRKGRNGKTLAEEISDLPYKRQRRQLCLEEERGLPE